MESPHWSYVTRIAVTIICLLGGIALLVFAMPLVQALVIAALMAYLLNPLVGRLMRRFRMRRPLAVALVYLVFVILLASLPALLGTLAFGMVSRLGDNMLLILNELDKELSRPLFLLGYNLSPRTLITNMWQSLGGNLSALPRGSFDILSGITTNLLWGVVILMSLYYFLKDGPQIKPWLLRLTPTSYQGEFSQLLDELDYVWGLFLRVQLLIFLILVALFILGTAVLVWLYQHGLIPFSTFGLIVLLVVLYALVQQLDNLWLRPQLMGHQLRLHPGLVFVGLIGALVLSGFFGALVVVPLIASAKVVGHYIRCKLQDEPPWPEELAAEPSQQSSPPPLVGEES